MLFSYKNTAKIKEADIVKTANSLSEYIDHLNIVAELNNYYFFESSINLPFDTDMINYIHGLSKAMVSPKLKYILDIGIGGSNLGTKAVYDALYGYFDVVEPDRFPKMLFADTNDTDYIVRLQRLLKSVKSPEEIIITAVSKSGSTTEAVANLEILLSKNAFDFKSRLVIITDFGSPLWKQATKLDIKCLPIPEKVGGRYSVFSAVGMFPLLCAGVNIFELLGGAMELRSKCLKRPAIKNPAVLSAVVTYLNFKNGKKINDTFIFHPELESLGKWYRQLMGESIGKQGTGITPTVSIGSTDLHSMGQLYLGGPKDKFFTFISTVGHRKNVKVPQNASIPIISEELRGKSTNQIMEAIFKGVKTAYDKNDLPYVEIKFQNINETSIGKYMQLKMIEMMFLGQLLNVNAFDQPNVESYKVETQKILSSTKST